MPTFRGNEFDRICRNNAEDVYELWMGDTLVHRIDSRAFHCFPQLKQMRLSSGNRKPNQTTHYRSSGASRSGPGGPKARVSLLPGSVNAVSYAGAGLIAPPPFVWPFGYDQPEFSQIPYAGVKAGELIGHRFWFADVNSFLWSFTQPVMWEPGQVITGDPRKRHGARGLGVYAFKSSKDLETEAHECHQYVKSHLFPLDGYWTEANNGVGFRCVGVIFGTVYMWGEVVEHECGYRAEFAKVRTVSHYYGGRWLADIFGDLKTRYERKAGKNDKSVP